MKTSTFGLVSAAILMVLAGVGFGIAQAGDTHTTGEFMEWQTLEASGGSQTAAAGSHTIGEFMEWQSSQAAISPTEDMQLASAGQEFVPEDNWSGTDWQTRGPVETGAIPGAVFEESWMNDYGND
jgi:hypothetical protein